MRIAVVAHVRHPVAEPFMGGMEAHCWHLARGLATRGHAVTLFAAGDSAAGVALHPVVARHYDRAFPWHGFHGTAALNLHLDTAFARAARALLEGGFDVVHNNSLHRYPPRLARAARLPTVTSLHVPPFDALWRAVRESAAPWARFTVTSARQRQVWWPEGAPAEASVVHNGIDPRLWPQTARGDGGAVWSGRITANKGAHLAIAAARAAGVPLTLFGAIEQGDYFAAEIRPQLGPGIRYGGHLPGPALAAELGRASAFLFTPLWEEPFGLAAVEAMACGLPVAAHDIGAVREVLGEAGRYAPPGDVPALAAALDQALALPRALPRARVEALFTLERMLEGYEGAYAAAIAGLAEERPPADFPPIELTVAPPAPAAAE